MEMLVCNSCKKKITNKEGSAQFDCPSCGKYKIIRCKHCRDLAAKYACPGCNFIGPN